MSWPSLARRSSGSRSSVQPSSVEMYSRTPGSKTKKPAAIQRVLRSASRGSGSTRPSSVAVDDAEAAGRADGRTVAEPAVRRVEREQLGEVDVGDAVAVGDHEALAVDVFAARA